METGCGFWYSSKKRKRYLYEKNNRNTFGNCFNKLRDMFNIVYQLCWRTIIDIGFIIFVTNHWPNKSASWRWCDDGRWWNCLMLEINVMRLCKSSLHRFFSNYICFFEKVNSDFRVQLNIMFIICFRTISYFMDWFIYMIWLLYNIVNDSCWQWFV